MFVDIKHLNVNACEHAIRKHLNIGVGNHQSVQVYEHESTQASGLMIIKAGRHWNIRSSKPVNKEASEHQSM